MTPRLYKRVQSKTGPKKHPSLLCPCQNKIPTTVYPKKYTPCAYPCQSKVSPQTALTNRQTGPQSFSSSKKGKCAYCGHPYRIVVPKQKYTLTPEEADREIRRMRADEQEQVSDMIIAHLKEKIRKLETSHQTTSSPAESASPSPPPSSAKTSSQAQKKDTKSSKSVSKDVDDLDADDFDEDDLFADIDLQM